LASAHWAFDVHALEFTHTWFGPQVVLSDVEQAVGGGPPPVASPIHIVSRPLLV
jgi:hypothetical protein